MSNLDILNSKNQSFFLPIGGIGEIGGNNYLYSFKGEQIIVDAGISFADDSLPGVDITIPDPYIFLNPSIKPKAMILTMHMKIMSVVLNTILIRSIFQFTAISLLTLILNINSKEFLILKKNSISSKAIKKFLLRTFLFN